MRSQMRWSGEMGKGVVNVPLRVAGAANKKVGRKGRLGASFGFRGGRRSRVGVVSGIYHRMSTDDRQRRRRELLADVPCRIGAGVETGGLAGETGGPAGTEAGSFGVGTSAGAVSSGGCWPRRKTCEKRNEDARVQGSDDGAFAVYHAGSGMEKTDGEMWGNVYEEGDEVIAEAGEKAGGR